MRKGRFAIRLMHDQKIYYQCFEVCPQNVNDDEWAIMQKELEEEIQGLSSDIIRKNIALVQKFLNKWTIFLFCSILFSSNQKEH